MLRLSESTKGGLLGGVRPKRRQAQLKKAREAKSLKVSRPVHLNAPHDSSLQAAEAALEVSEVPAPEPEAAAEAAVDEALPPYVCVRACV